MFRRASVDAHDNDRGLVLDEFDSKMIVVRSLASPCQFVKRTQRTERQTEIRNKNKKKGVNTPKSKRVYGIEHFFGPVFLALRHYSVVCV